MGEMEHNGASCPRGAVIAGRFAELEGALVERVAELRRAGGLRPITVVVGSSAVSSRITELLVWRLGAVANVRVLVLRRLALELVAGGAGPPAVLVGSARERLVRRLIAERAASHAGLAYFGPVAERPHFARAITSTFTDLREALVAPRSGWATAALCTGPSAGFASAAARGRAADLTALYAAYCDELAARDLLDDAALFVRAASAVREGGPAMLLYGMYDFNRAQEELVRALLLAGADLFVPASWGAAARGASASEDDPAASALALARSLGLREGALSPPACTVDRDRLAALWGARSRVASPGKLLGDGTLEVVSVADERAEVREALRVLLGAFESGAALRECAVVVPHAREAERYAAGLRSLGLAVEPEAVGSEPSVSSPSPVACKLPDRSLGPRVLLRLAECLAPAAGEPFARRAVLDLLTAAPLREVSASPSETALWLDEARRAGCSPGSVSGTSVSFAVAARWSTGSLPSGRRGRTTMRLRSLGRRSFSSACAL